MREIQATEAKTRLAELLLAVEHGGAITITRHGKPVAQLVPAGSQDRVSRKKAVDRFRRRRAGWRRVAISADEILTWRHEGHHL